MTTVSLFPQFMGQLGTQAGGTIIVGGLEVSVVDELLAEIELEIAAEEVQEVLVPTDASNITVEVENEHDVGLEAC